MDGGGSGNRPKIIAFQSPHGYTSTSLLCSLAPPNCLSMNILQLHGFTADTFATHPHLSLNNLEREVV